MKNLGTILKQRYPHAQPRSWEFYEVQDDGKGPYIAAWDETTLGPRPTDEQLAQWQAEFDVAPPPTPKKTAYEEIADLKIRLEALEAKS
jgi:hypothetical protein